MRPIVSSGNTGFRRIRFRGNHNAHRKIEGARKIKVALIVGRNRHDRAGSIIRQHVIRRPDRDALTVHRIDRVTLKEHTRLIPGVIKSIHFRGLLHLFEVFGKSTFGAGSCRKFGSQIRIGRNHEECCAVERVWSSCINRYRFFTALNLKFHFSAGGLANPIALHQQHLLRPLAFEILHIV